jgi:putative RNA 2'-phosphotransferase
MLNGNCKLMMTEKEEKRNSKFMSLVLRHKPEIIDLELDANGWADVNELIEKLARHGAPMTLAELEHIVATNSKKRFAFDDSHTKIRASQGHSLGVDLQLKEAVPPEYLYHGTGEKSVDAILAQGLEKRTRQHVHLSTDIPTAIAVGSRNGRPRVFRVAASQMHADGMLFYLSENKVWLADHVPVRYLQLLDR